MTIATRTLPPAEMVPRTWLPLDIHAKDGAALRAWVRRGGQGVIELGTIAAVPLRPADVACLAVAALELLADRLAQRPPATHRQALRARVRAFIESHLGEPGLTPAAVAAAHRISLRYLHKAVRARAARGGRVDPAAAAGALPGRLAGSCAG